MYSMDIDRYFFDRIYLLSLYVIRYPNERKKIHRTSKVNYGDEVAQNIREHSAPKRYSFYR